MRRQLHLLWTESPSLTATCILMLVAFVFSLAGIFLDSRIISGAPAWLKPAKFAISTAIFAASIAWLFRYMTRWPKLKRALGWVLTVVLVLEVALIDVQAARGTTSHFNVGNNADATIFAIMGIAIGILWLAMIALTVMLFRQRFADRAWGWTLRLGMLISVLGAGSAGLMVSPTPSQKLEISHHDRPKVIGAHTVGAPDGGPGLPAVAWSTHHGDLRIPHFFGLHALQILPLLAWFTRRKRHDVPFVFSLAASYLGLTGILTWQALRGQSIVQPDAATLTAMAVWFVATLATAFWSRVPAAVESPRVIGAI